MSHVEVRQIGHVAATPVAKTLTANGRTQNKTLVTVISNSRWKDPQGKVSEKATAISWTLWGKVAVNASWYLDVGSKVAVAGTLEGNRYTGKDGEEVFGAANPLPLFLSCGARRTIQIHSNSFGETPSGLAMPGRNASFNPAGA